MTHFDLTGPLPTGTTVIEASAGTGKTYAIAGLAARYIAEGVAELPELMLVTFGRAASQELRERVRARARTLRARIDLRQLGPRDEARVQGGVGPCGRETCCSTFLKDFEPVSIRMAKEQDLPLNPLKISGACGRLMCCLKYEHPLYQDFKRSVPTVGCGVETDTGVTGTVTGYNVPSETVYVRDRETGRKVACPKASVCGSRQQYESAVKSGMRATPDEALDEGDEHHAHRGDEEL
jgi:cell fate regulator YaaT (PSP1 superfamily)